MCLRISKTLRPKILSASGFQPNSKLESVENPGLQIPDAHVASDQRCCGGRMWLRGIEFPFSKGWPNCWKEVPPQVSSQFIAQAKCKKKWKGDDEENVKTLVYSSKRKNWLPNMPNVSRSGWTCGLGLTQLKSYQKDEVIVEGFPYMSGLPGFYSLKDRGDPGKGAI